MPQPFPQLPLCRRGQVRCIEHHADTLAGNPWGDPTRRDIWVYTPPGYEARPGRRYPAILLLAPYAGTGEALLGRSLTEVSMATRIDQLLAAGGCPPFVAVMPDGMTRLGGSQYVDSPGIGRYSSWLMDEVLGSVDAHFRTSGRWAVAGRSSGGFGALHLAMSYPGRFVGAASLAGDMGFDLAYLAELPASVAPIRAAGGPRAFVDAFWRKNRPSGGAFSALSLLCLSAAYTRDAGPSADGFPARLPVDYDTGEIDFEVFASWRRFDPVVRAALAPEQEALSQLDLLLLDAGDRDEYHLQLGARRLVRVLEEAGIEHAYEEFPGGHRGTSYRFDACLPRLARMLDGD